MKLFFCEKCQDVLKFQNVGTPLRFCSCGQCAGWYLEEGKKAELFGPAIPLGLDNFSLPYVLQILRHLRAHPEALEFFSLEHRKISAFGILEPCPTIQRVDLQTLMERFPPY